MRALVNFGPSAKQLELRNVAEPTCGASDVLIAVEAVAICGSDIHVMHGNVSWAMAYPVTLGHEFSGTVAAVGSDVANYRVGDRVVSETAAWIDPHSRWARTGDYNVDPTRRGFGAQANGAMADLVVVPERCLHAVPASVPFDVAALTEPLCVAYQAVSVRTEVKPGDLVVVIGVGAVGLLAAWLAQLSGARRTIVVGRPADIPRTNLAQGLGLDLITGSKNETVDQVLGVSSAGADIVIDAAGVSQALQLALEVVRPNGQVTKVGWGPEPLNFSLDPLVAKAITLRGSFSHTWPVWERAMTLLESYKEQIGSIIGWHGGLHDWQSGFDLQSTGKIVKGVIQPPLG